VNKGRFLVEKMKEEENKCPTLKEEEIMDGFWRWKHEAEWKKEKKRREYPLKKKDEKEKFGFEQSVQKEGGT
jgi:hypothetical protein